MRSKATSLQAATPGRRWSAIGAFLMLSVFVLLVACGGDSDNGTPTPGAAVASSTPPPEATQTPAVTQPPAATPEPSPQPSPTEPPPIGASPCPIDVAVCDMGVLLLPIIASGDVDAFMAHTEPVPAVCTGIPGLGGPSNALCQGAAVGETRHGYWDVQGGEGLVVTEEEFRRTLQRWFSLIPQATGEDEYGPGEVHIGSVACARPTSQPSGVCGEGWLRVHFTLISPATDPSQGVGIPGERTTFHVSLHRGADGMLKVDGFGTTVPPNDVLLPLTLEVQNDEGERVLLEFYPWTY